MKEWRRRSGQPTSGQEVSSDEEASEDQEQAQRDEHDPGEAFGGFTVAFGDAGSRAQAELCGEDCSDVPGVVERRVHVL